MVQEREHTDSDSDGSFDPLHYLGSMAQGATGDAQATSTLHMQAASGLAPPDIAASLIADAAIAANMTHGGFCDEEDVEVRPSCFELWRREGSTPALADSLSRHLARLRLQGFELPWKCGICGCICAKWFGGCEQCKSPNAAYSSAGAIVLASEQALPREARSQDHVLLALARKKGLNEIEACFLMCEAMACVHSESAHLYRRAFKLWPALDSGIYPDGVPSHLRAEADALLVTRCGDVVGGTSAGSTALWGIFPPGWETPTSIALASQAAKELECSRARLRKEADVVVVYSYHQAEGAEPGSWWEQARRSASALRRVHADHIEFPIHIVCNVDTKGHDDSGVFDEHILTNLAVDAGLEAKGRILCGTKIQAMLNRFAKGYKKVIYMDSDTHILRAFLSPMLAVLDSYDLTGVFEGYPMGMPQTGLDPALADPQNFEMGFELNTGVLGLRASACELCMAWLEEFRAHGHAYAAVSSADQPALMQVLKHRSERFFPLPPTFNFRCFSVFSPAGPSVPAVVHDHQGDCGTAQREIVDAVCSHLRAGLPTG